MPYEWLEATEHPGAISDADGHVLAVNSAFERRFGVSRSRIVSESLEELILPSRFRSAYRVWRRSVLADEPSLLADLTRAFSALTADGGEFPVVLSLARTSEHPPEVGTWAQDVTDSPSATPPMGPAALGDRTEALAGVGTWVWEPEKGRLRWSDNMFRIRGLEPGEITPSIEYSLDRCDPEDRERVEHAIEAARTGHMPPLTYRYLWPDGTAHHLRATVASVTESEGRPRQVVGTVQDITETYEAELEMAARLAVSDALSHWQAGGLGARRLVRDLAEALEADAGVLWVPRAAVLVAWVEWVAPSLHLPRLDSALREVRLEPGVGLAGRSWASAEPVYVTDLADVAASAVRNVVSEGGLRVALALPATHDDRVLAVLTLAARKQMLLTDRLMRSLSSMGQEIGRFLAGHGAELSPPSLTPRELQVLQLSARGHARRQIAERIGVSEATVKTHFEHIFRKLGVADRASAVAEAMRLGLVD